MKEQLNSVIDGELPPILSNVQPDRRQRRAAEWVLAVSLLIFLMVAPFADRPLPPLAAFLPLYQAAYVTITLVTAHLLFGQYRLGKAPAMAILAGGYVFDAAMGVAHALSFPGLFAPGGLLGAGPQTTAWLYFLWHGGFALFVIGYARCAGGWQESLAARVSVPGLRLGVVCGALALAAAMVLVTTRGHDALPVIMRGDVDASAKMLVASMAWLLGVVALLALWRRRPHSLLDLWLLVAVLAWIFDSALASVLNHARFDVGWYAGRLYGLFAGSLILFMLLRQNGVLYVQLARLRAQERRRGEAQLRESEAHFHAIFDGILDAVVFTDAARRIRLVNPSFVRLWGYTPQEAAGRTTEFLYADPEDFSVLEGGEDNSPGQRPMDSFEMRFRRKDGSEFWAGASRAGIVAADGSLTGFICILHDITERKHTEQALALSEATHRAIIETSTDGFWMIDAERRLVAVNDAYVRRSGYSREALLQMCIEDLDAREDAAAAGLHHARLVDLGADLFETWHRARDGSLWPVEVMATFWPEAGGRYFAFLRDITERKRMLGALQVSEMLYRLTFDQAAIGMAHVALDGRWLRVNRKACEIFGYGEEELRSLGFQNLTHPEDMGSSLDQLKRLLAGEIPSCVFEKRYLRKDHSVVWANVTIAVVPDADGAPDYFVSVIEDISARKRAEEELQLLRTETERLMRVQVASQTAAALAHELNQPLNAVSSYAAAALRMLQGDHWKVDKLHYAVENSALQAQRAGRVVSELLAFLNQGEVLREALDLGELAGRVCARIRLDAPDRLRLRLAIAENLPAVSANRLQIEKVLANLVDNGIEAALHAGRSEADIAVQVEKSADGAMVQLSVSDNGPGVDANLLRRIFEPFFTTKAQGLGMGLAISRSIIDAHGGKLWVESPPEGGARFHFTLPIAD